MSLRSTIVSLASTAVAVAAFACVSFAQDSKAVAPAPADKPFHHGDHNKGDRMGHRGGFGHRGMGMMRAFHELNLTDAQKTQIHSIMEGNKPDQATMEEMKTLRKAKHEGTLTADQQSRLTALREQSKAKMQTVHEQLLNVLTAEQKAQLEAKKAEMKARREEFRQKREQWRQQKQAAPAATTETPKVN